MLIGHYSFPKYIRTINPEADRIALYPGGKTYRPHSLFNLSPETTVQHVAELQKYIVQDNVVYLPADSSTYRNLNSFVYGKGISLEKYIEKPNETAKICKFAGRSDAKPCANLK